MKILAISDVESKLYYDFFTPGMLDEFDLILSCGDLHREYLEFLVTMSHCPLVYVPGNHDARFETRPPEGCVCADGDVVVVNGVRILGLGGSYRYKPGPCMYTEKEMVLRVLRVLPKIWLRRGFDILLTHAPARHINDLDTVTHRGFEVFLKLMDRYRPKYLVHGHVHLTYGRVPRRAKRGETEVVNAFDHVVIEI